MPHPGQRAVMRNLTRFNWVFAGRRWRKTSLALMVILEAALKHKGVYFWGAPVFDQARIGFRESQRALKRLAYYNRTRLEVILPNGSVLYFRSLEAFDNLRGFTADGWVLDEVAKIKPAAYYEVIRPTLMDTEGWLLAIGTPRPNWVYREVMSFDDREDSRVWQIPTRGCVLDAEGHLVPDPHPYENPFMPFSEIQNLYDTLQWRQFRQEILSHWVEDEGAVFRNLDKVIILEPVETLPYPRTIVPKAGHYVMGIDWGREKDYTVVSIIDVRTGQCVGYDRFRRLDYSIQRDRIVTLLHTWRPKTVVVELNAMGRPNFEELIRAVDGINFVGFTTTARSKANIIQALALAFEKGDLTVIKTEVTINELRSFQVIERASGLSDYTAPEGMHDDFVMALALGWYAVTESPALNIGTLPKALSEYRG